MWWSPTMFVLKYFTLELIWHRLKSSCSEVCADSSSGLFSKCLFRSVTGYSFSWLLLSCSFHFSKCLYLHFFFFFLLTDASSPGHVEVAGHSPQSDYQNYGIYFPVFYIISVTFYYVQSLSNGIHIEIRLSKGMWTKSWFCVFVFQSRPA